MSGTDAFPERYRKNIKILVDRLNTDAETAFSMMVMTAALMDLYPDDQQVTEIIIDDCEGLQAVRKNEW